MKGGKKVRIIYFIMASLTPVLAAETTSKLLASKLLNHDGFFKHAVQNYLQVNMCVGPCVWRTYIAPILFRDR